MSNEDVAPEEVVYHAGFPNAAEDGNPMGLSLDKLVIRRPVSTYFWHLAEDMPPEPGWRAGDIVVVDRSLSPAPNDWVVAIIDNQFVLCRYASKTQLVRADGVGAGEAAIWGTVTYIVQKAASR